MNNGQWTIIFSPDFEYIIDFKSIDYYCPFAIVKTITVNIFYFVFIATVLACP
jgi:hypothetical protein